MVVVTQAPIALRWSDAAPEAGMTVVTSTMLVVGGDDLALVARAAAADLGGAVTTSSSWDGLAGALVDPGPDIVILDLRSVASDAVGMIGRERPDLPVVVITPGSATPTAVEAMREGAVDAIEWPVSPEQLRTVVVRHSQPGDRRLQEEYAERVSAARRQILARAFAPAKAQLMRALALDVTRPDAFNLLGVLAHVHGARMAAQTWWRMAVLIDPAYHPAQDNLTRSIRRPPPPGPLRLG
jgi:FixJ family two-component response regulator